MRDLPKKAEGPLRVIYFVDFEDFQKKRHPGSIFLTKTDRFGEWSLIYCCPCGCGHVDKINVGAGFKPPNSPSWNWNSSTTEPTLLPSVNRKGHWHGHLRDGYWVSV